MRELDLGPSFAGLEALFQSGWIWEKLPQIARSEPPHDERYAQIMQEVVRRLSLKERAEWESYGSGYASFVDVWLYRDEPQFRRPLYDKADYSFTGLWVALCRHAPCYVMGEGEQSWSAVNGGSYLPSLEGVDALKTPAVALLANEVEGVLNEHGLVRLRKSDVEIPLPQDVQFESNLAHGALRIFDAFFFWND